MTAACVLQTFPDTARAHAMILGTGSCCGQGERPVEYLDAAGQPMSTETSPLVHWRNSLSLSAGFGAS